MNVQPPEFLHVPTLLDQSVPRPARHWVWYFGAGLLLLLTLSGATHAQGGGAAMAIDILIALLIGAFFIFASLMSSRISKGLTAEHAKIDGVSELITLRRWAEAAVMLQDVLSSPLRSQGSRVQALIYLAGLLGRYHRFEDAISVYDYLLDEYGLDPRTQRALKLGRAMSLLRNDQLFDADRAIADLRRSVRRGTVDESSETEPTPQLSETAGLALLEIYRDVKTGHPEEAIQLFNQSKDAIRKQFGHRLADAYALVARAYDLLGRDAEAKEAFENATLLAPLSELTRRFPEVRSLVEKYAPASSPYADSRTAPPALGEGVLA